MTKVDRLHEGGCVSPFWGFFVCLYFLRFIPPPLSRPSKGLDGRWITKTTQRTIVLREGYLEHTSDTNVRPNYTIFFWLIIRVIWFSLVSTVTIRAVTPNIVRV